MTPRALLPTLLITARMATAQDFSGGGFADMRLSVNSAERAAADGGLGKLRYGGDDTTSGSGVRLANLDLNGRAQLTEDLMVFADLRSQPDQKTAVDLDQAYIRYRPVSLSPWRWSIKAGAFFPPISLENNGPGWSSPWTLTPSVINSWVGEELRSIGFEPSVEWRGSEDHVSAVVGLFCDNDPAGVAIAEQGWVMTDRITGLFDPLRLPDALAPGRGAVTTQLFREIDNRPGLYAGAAWQHQGLGTLSLLTYNNHADPAAFNQGFAWHTRFNSISLQTELGPLTLLSQAMVGKTAVNPEGDETYATHFQSGYLLAGSRFGLWRLAVRAELFATEADNHDPGERLSEHGSAGTVALSWQPWPWLRLTGETILADSWRTQRLQVGHSAGQVDRQLLMNSRILF